MLLFFKKGKIKNRVQIKNTVLNFFYQALLKTHNSNFPDDSTTTPEPG